MSTVREQMVEALEAYGHSAVCRNEDTQWAGKCLRCMALDRARAEPEGGCQGATSRPLTSGGRA